MNYITRRERHVRIGIIRDLIRMNMLTCKPISKLRDTRELAALTTRKLAVAQAETVTCEAEHASER